MMVKPGYTGVQRVIKATEYSWQGFRAAWKNESAFRQECIIGLMMLPFAFVIGQTMLQVAVLICVLGIVLITELLNSAIEAVVDRRGVRIPRPSRTGQGHGLSRRVRQSHHGRHCLDAGRDQPLYCLVKVLQK